MEKRRVRKKIQLVNSPLSQDFTESSKAGSYPPLNLLTLATYLQQRLPGIDIEILDGEIISLKKILLEVEADIVGISSGILSYETAVQIANVASKRGSKVIMGGAYPTSMAKLILSNRRSVDAVVLNDGEESLLLYLLDKDIDKIPNLAYRKDGNIFFNKEIVNPINAVSITNYELINLSKYFNNFQKNYPTKPFNGAFSIFSSKGCLWRDISGGCIYCALQTYGYRTKSPETIWHEIKELHNKYNIDFFWDVSDTFTRPLNRLKDIAKNKPNNLDVSLLLYGRSDDINDYVAKLLSYIGTHEVFIGVESGDNNILYTANRGQNSSDALTAVQTLAKYGIKTIVSFQFGLPGESEESCKSSLKLAKKLGETGTVTEVFSSVLLPMPGSMTFRMLMQNKKVQKKYRGKDIFSIEKLRKDFINQFCNVSYDYIKQVRDKIMDFFPMASSLGKEKE